MQKNITLISTRFLLRKTLATLGLLCLITMATQAQSFINGPLSTGATASDGTAAPTGTTWSQLQLNNNSAGAGANISAGFTLADDFTIPAGVTWAITKITFYAYSTGYTGTTSPFNDTRVQIFNTDPSTGNPTPVFGNLTTNRLAASSFADMFRVGAVTDLSRRIWKIEATVNTTLPAGHYWIEWQHGTIAGVTSNFSPAKTVTGTATQPGNNAKQHDIGAAAWINLLDGGSQTPQDMPFQVDYTATGTPCAATNPGATISSLAEACPGTAFTLSAANPGGGLGISYQWQSSANGTTFNDIPGAVNPTLTTTQTAATWYQLKVTCAAGTPATSTPVRVNIPAICYCIAGATDPGNEKIARVQFGTLNNSSTSSPGGYQDFTALTPVASFDIGSVTPITVTGSGTYAFDAVNVWIDYNKDGDFNDVGELVFESNLGVGPYTGNVTIPADALLGNTRMRVRIIDIFATVFGNDTDGPCGTNQFGEVEDYTINIAPCKPVAFPTATANATTTCGRNATFTTTATGSGLKYQWQYRTGATAAWLPVTETGIYSGTTTATLTLTNISEAYNGYGYRPLVSGACSGTTFGAAGVLTVNKATPVITPATPSVCVGSIQQLTLTNTTTALLINEGFNTATPLPAGWQQQNRSVPAGTGVNATWRQGTADPFPANSGVPTSYIKCDWRSTTTVGTISNWLFTPVINIKNGDVLTFYTRVPIDATTLRVEFPDRMQVRLSTNGASTNVGTTATSVGDFNRLLLDINPNLTVFDYPTEWKRFTVTISGIAAPVTGRIAFRYFVTNGGTDGANSNVVGLDDVTYESTNLPAQGIWTSASPATMFTDATATTPYVAGTPASSIFVKPATTTDYNVTFSTPTPCASAVGTVKVVVGQLITGTSTVADQSVCVNGTAVFSASAPATGSPIGHQWKVSTNGGVTFTNIAGATTATLTLTNVTAAMNGYKYKDSLFVTSCASFVNTNVATLTVNPAPVLNLTASPFTGIYPGQTTTLAVASTTTVPANGYTWYRNGVEVPGAKANTLVVDIDNLGEYTVSVTDANGCGNTARVSITITAAPNDIMFIYPSPNTGQFQVRYYSANGNNPLPRVVNIYDSKGARVYSKTYTVTVPYTRMDVDMSGFQKGIYQVELLDRNGSRLKTGRVVIL